MNQANQLRAESSLIWKHFKVDLKQKKFIKKNAQNTKVQFEFVTCVVFVWVCVSKYIINCIFLLKWFQSYFKQHHGKQLRIRCVSAEENNTLFISLNISA